MFALSLFRSQAAETHQTGYCERRLWAEPGPKRLTASGHEQHHGKAADSSHRAAQSFRSGHSPR